MSLKRILNILVLVSCLMFIFSETYAQVYLLNIQKGAEGKKAWTILTFDKNVKILGIANQKYSSVSLYLQCLTRNYDNSIISLSETLNREIKVDQIRTEPMIAKFTIVCNYDVPLSILRKDRYIVISMESDKLLTPEKSVGAMDIFESSGRLIDVYNTAKEERSVTTLKLEGNYEWIGFFRPSPGNCGLLINNAILLTSEDQYRYTNNPLTEVQLEADNQKTNRTIVNMSLEPLHGYSIFDVNNEITIRTEMEQTMYPALAAEEEKEEQPADDLVSVDYIDSDEVTLESLFMTEEVPESREDEVKQTPVASQKQISEEKRQEAEEQPVTPSYKPEAQVERDVVTPQPEIKPEPEPSGIPWNAPLPSMNFRSAPLKDVLRTIGDPFNLNLLIDEAVDDSVTFRLSGITLRQAFDKLLHTHDCEYLVDDGIIIVKPTRVAYRGGLITEIFRLEYADANNVAEVIKPMVSADSLVKVYHNEFLSKEVGTTNRQKSNEVAVQGIRRTSVLIITERPEKIEKIKKIIAELDVQPVLFEIKSKLVEAAPMDKSKLGINWDKTLTTILSNQISSSSGGGSAGEGYSGINTNPGSIGQLQLASLTTGQYEAVIDFLREKTDSRLKSRPSIIAMDNEEASISVGTTVPIPKIQRGMGGQGDMVTFEYKEVNIQLNVTAHLGKNDNIIMYVNPVIEEITDWVVYEEQRAPITSKRAVNTFVRVKNGETVVIGGLMKSKRQKTRNKVWLLGSIPLIGKLFQSESYEYTQSDVLIFITPTVVNL